MVNYKNGKIYKIVSSQTDKIYIGSTTKKYLSQRLQKHRESYGQYQKGKGRKITSFDILQYGDACIILLENIPCNSKEELLSKERYWIENSQNVVNKYVPLQTSKEYEQKHKKKREQYRKDNKDRIAKRKQEYYKKTKDDKLKKVECECGSIYCKSTRARHLKTKKHQEFINKK